MQVIHSLPRSGELANTHGLCREQVWTHGLEKSVWQNAMTSTDRQQVRVGKMTWVNSLAEIIVLQS